MRNATSSCLHHKKVKDFNLLHPDLFTGYSVQSELNSLQSLKLVLLMYNDTFLKFREN